MYNNSSVPILCNTLTYRFHVAICSVIDCRWSQRSGMRGDSWVCHWCSYYILTSSVIYYWTDAWQHGIYLFYIIKKQNTTEKAFLRPLSRTLPALTTTKKSHLTWSIVYTSEAISLVAMHSKRISIGPRKSRHCQARLEHRSSWNENLQRKQNWTAKSTNLEENAGKIETVFVIRAALWAE